MLGGKTSSSHLMNLIAWPTQWCFSSVLLYHMSGQNAALTWERLPGFDHWFLLHRFLLRLLGAAVWHGLSLQLAQADDPEEGGPPVGLGIAVSAQVPTGQALSAYLLTPSCKTKEQPEQRANMNDCHWMYSHFCFIRQHDCLCITNQNHFQFNCKVTGKKEYGSRGHVPDSNP